jgi:asparagine synthase (glutamine-hydrolysing)
MSHFLAVFDPNAEHRLACLRESKAHLAELGLEVISFESGNFAAAWACARAWPGKHWAGPDEDALLMGHALERGERLVQAADLPRLWKEAPAKVPEPFDGIHMALWRHGRRVIVSGDILGRFPIYYHSGADRLLIASSPDLFRSHPGWRSEVDVEAIAGLLLVNYFLQGRSLWKNVRRLGAGNLLVWENGHLEERVQFRIPHSDEHFGSSFERHCELVHDALNAAVDRQMPNGLDYELFCSGGLDSRMLAGYLRGRGLIKRGITWGDPNDFEMNCARKMVRKMGIEHETWPVRTEKYPLFARRSIKWHSLALGFNALSFWQDRRTAAAPGGFVSGQAMDCSIGGGAVLGSEVAAGQPAAFAQLFARDNGWGLPVELLQQLFRAEVFGDSLTTAMQEMKQTYQQSGERDFQRINAYTLLHRHRYHTAAVIGLHGLWGWPVLPAFDRRVLAVLGGIPKESFLQRRIQKHLVCTRFPDLARLPLDRNSIDTRPLLPRYGERGEKWLLKVRRKIGRLSGADKKERRFYYRIMDFNGPGWRAVREEAEPGRKLLEPFFHREVLDRLVPPPGATLREENIPKNPATVNMDMIKCTSGVKLLTGLMLWARARL